MEGKNKAENKKDGNGTRLWALKSFFSEMEAGCLDAQMDSIVMEREDELSEIGQSALALQRGLQRFAEHDALTDLYNRRGGERRLNATLKKAREEKEPFVLAIGDVDFFKRVNDTYGHQRGDLVLKKVAAIMKKHMRGRGYAIRWGGEEFLLVYENCPLEAALEDLGILQREVRDTCGKAEGSRVDVTMTFGVAAAQPKELEELLREADDKLYYGKNNGRNKIVAELPGGLYMGAYHHGV